MRNQRMKDEGGRMKKGAPAQRRSPRSFSSFILPPSSLRTRAFSLTELLIVIGIIVLALALAVPALNLITGAKSTEQGQNIVSSVLAQARNDAIGIQQYRGVFFYQDPLSKQVKAAMVQEVDPPDTAMSGVDVYLDLVEDRDVSPLPRGVQMQIVDDAGGSAGPPAIPLNDRYLGFNTVGKGPTSPTSVGPITTKTPYGGVILFDSHGQLSSRVYALQTHRFNPAPGHNRDEYTLMGALLYDKQPGDASGSDKDVVPTDPSSNLAVKSQFGFVLYEEDPFRSAGFDDADAQITGAPYASGSQEYNEEGWLDENGAPVLINRYNGSLIKSQ